MLVAARSISSQSVFSIRCQSLGQPVPLSACVVVKQDGIQVEKDVLPDGHSGVDSFRLLARMGRQIRDGALSNGRVDHIEWPDTAIHRVPEEWCRAVGISTLPSGYSVDEGPRDQDA